MTKKVRFQKVRCIKPSSGLDNTALNACRSFFTAAGGFMFAGSGMTGAVPVAVAGVGVVALTQASTAVIGALGRSFAGGDQLYLKVNGARAWPGGGGKYMNIGSQQEYNLNLVYDLTGPVELSLYEYDSGSSDDYMGHVRLETNTPVGSVAVVIPHEPEASVYLVCYEVFEG